MLTTLSAIAAVAKLLSLGLSWWERRSATQAAIAKSQLDADNAEITRLNSAANAGNAAGGVRNGQADPYDEAGK